MSCAFVFHYQKLQWSVKIGRIVAWIWSGGWEIGDTIALIEFELRSPRVALEYLAEVPV